jgi:hypothetical protein
VSRTFTIATPVTPDRFALYGLASLTGLVYLLGSAGPTQKVMTEWLGPSFTGAWAFVFFIAPLVVMAGAVTTARGHVVTGLRVEQWAALATGVAAALFFLALIRGYGWGAPVASIFSLLIVFGPLGRALQVRYELKRVHRALANPQPTDPAPLGDPDDSR